MRRVDTSGDCWNWTGSKQSQGYGVLVKHVWGENLAHRWMYKHTHGELPAEALVRHRCDNKPCVNPSHLELGAAKDNVRDMIERNPHACGRKLTNAQVAEILELREGGEFYHDIAMMYGVNRRTVEKICIGKKTYSLSHRGATPHLSKRANAGPLHAN